MRIHPEKRNTIMTEIAQMGGKPSANVMESLARRHGVSVATIRNWIRDLEKKIAVRNAAPPPRPVEVAAPARSEHGEKNILLRHLAAQALFLAEQLELLADK